MGRVLVMTMLLIGLTACNMVQGAGRDIESVGRAGKDAMR